MPTVRSAHGRDPSRQRLVLKCSDKDTLTADDALGFAMLPVEALCDGERHELDLELQGPGGGGRVQLSAVFAPFTGGGLLRVAASPQAGPRDGRGRWQSSEGAGSVRMHAEAS